MKEVLALIENRKQEFALLPLFEYLQDRSIDPRQRLAFAPCLSPMIMGFADLWKDVFREEPTNNKIQALINLHTYEEQYHWHWLLEDMQKLELNQSLSFNDALKFIWGEETHKTRQVCHKIERCIFRGEPLKKLVALEVSEATANVFFSMTQQAANEMQGITKKQFRYFGGHHLGQENNHNINKSDALEVFEGILLTDEQRQEYFELVNQLFEAFAESMDELLAYAKAHKIEQLLPV